MPDKLFARTTLGPQSEWEELHDHLRSVGALTSQRTAKFDALEFGLAAGLLHDLGKAKPEFQDYMCRNGKAVSHSAEGGKTAQKHYGTPCDRANQAPIGRLIAAAILGHHAGLPNGQRHFDERLENAQTLGTLLELPALKLPRPLRNRLANSFALAFFTRMLFSALVDADRLVSEAADDKAEKRASLRPVPRPAATLKPALDAHLSENFPLAAATSDLDRLRAEVLSDCRSAAKLSPGFFSLTVPTGGGKTLSSLAFALDHAEAHQLDRVIYVIPFTSIIDQTVDVFRDALKDEEAILPHHSAFDDEELERLLASEDEGDGKQTVEKLRLAMQNWDSPIVVTTAVQFFESLYASSPKRCRKLHNLARSVVILDEAQTLPITLLRPCLAALKELVRGYDASVVFCTATQPALTDEAFAGIAISEAPPKEVLKKAKVREMIATDRNLFSRLRRVEAVQESTLSDDDLATAITDVDQGLIIVNNRRHARDLFEKLRKGGIAGACHLTTAMTAAHRQHALARIREDLRTCKPVRLVSTSLIEAGVDISFEAVWRAIAGLDQIVQAAGRCNRNGELGPGGGCLTIFEPEPVEGHAMPRTQAER